MQQQHPIRPHNRFGGVRESAVLEQQEEAEGRGGERQSIPDRLFTAYLCGAFLDLWHDERSGEERR